MDTRELQGLEYDECYPLNDTSTSLNDERSLTHRLAKSRYTRPFKRPFKWPKQFCTALYG